MIIKYKTSTLLICFGFILFGMSCSRQDLGIINGQVLDQDGNPLPEVSVKYIQYEHRVIIPYSTTFKPQSYGEVITDSNGTFTFKRKYERIKYTEINKKGYKSESLKPTFVRQDRHNINNPTLWLYKIRDNEKNNIIRLNSESYKLSDLEKIYFSIRRNKFTSIPTNNSDIEISLYKRIGDNSYPMIIRAQDGGIYCNKNDMPYAPAYGYEPGIIVNAKFGGWIPFFYYSPKKSLYVRAWLKIDTRKKTVTINYAYNKNGSRYIDFNFKKIKGITYTNTFANIERSVPLQKEWWAYADTRKLNLITSEKRLYEIWNNFKDTNIEPYRDTGRSYGNGGLANIEVFLANNPLTPKDILSELSKTKNAYVKRALLKNPSINNLDFQKLAKTIHEIDAEKYLSARNENMHDWVEFLYEFLPNENKKTND